MSKLSSETVHSAVQAILANSKKNKRKFVETIELQVAFKGYDPTKEKRFSGSIVLPHVPRPRMVVAVIGNDVHNAAADEIGCPNMTQDDLKLLNKEKKKVKQLAQRYDAFLATASIIRLIPRILGPGLSKAGKFPTSLNPNDNVKEKVDEVKATVKFALKSTKAICLGVAVANVGMSTNHIEENVTLAVNYLASLLPKNWQQIRRLYLKSTMGPSHKIFGL